MDPEGLSIHVVAAYDISPKVWERQVREAARKAYPGRTIGRILHVEPLLDGTTEVVVEDEGPEQ